MVEETYAGSLIKTAFSIKRALTIIIFIAVIHYHLLIINKRNNFMKIIIN